MAKKKELTKEEKLSLLIEEVNDALGVEGKIYLGEDHEPIERIRTGVLALDTITGGGIPRRRYTEFYGPESCCKTTAALLAVAAVQRRKGMAGWVVGEEFDDEWARKMGVDLDKLLRVEATTGDKMLETAATLLESGVLDMLVLDSVQGIGTVREYEAGVESESYAGAGAPQLWGRFYKRTRGVFNGRRSNAAIIGISQVRAPIGVFSRGAPAEDKPTGIKVILHWKCISLQFKKGEPKYADLKSEKRRMLRREFKVKCVKNKTAGTEGRVGAFWFKFGKNPGVDYDEELVRLGKVYELIDQRGKVLEGYGIRAQGSKERPAKDLFLEKLKKKPTLMKELRTDIIHAARR